MIRDNFEEEHKKECPITRDEVATRIATIYAIKYIKFWPQKAL